MKLDKFLEEENISSFESLPDGDTFIVLAEAEVEPMEVEFDGKMKTRYKLITDGKEYVVGVQVIRGMQEVQTKQPKIKRVRVTKTGEKLNTKYAVVGVQE